ncbi:MAG TPA: hypothetical protein VMM12_09560 [Longimicrobiales bacterium]|nr:hypothetical protein [Longimicrobiales bacterium]
MIRSGWTRLTTAPPAALAAGLAAVHLLLAGLAFDPTPHSGGDNVAYLTLAGSLVDLGAYLQLWDPAGGPHAQYPPGFPALLAAAMAVGITSWTALKTLVVLTSALAVALSYRWMRARGEPGMALGAGLLVAIAPGVVENSYWILSDVPFWAATMGALWFAARDRPLPAAALAFAALLLRAAGIPLVVAVALWLALRRRWAAAAGVLGLLVCLAVLWTLRARGTDVPYASDLWLANPYAPDQGTIGIGGLLDRVRENGRLYAFGILMALLAGADGVIADLVAGGLVALAAVGWARRVRSPGVPELMLPLYLGLVLAWPAPWAADRLILPILPVLLLYAAEGAGVLPERVPSMVRLGGVALVLIFATPALVAQQAWGAACREAASEFPSRCLHPDLRSFLALARWTDGRLPDGAAVLSRKPTFFHFFSGVPGRAYPFTTRPGALFEEAERAGARYVVLDRLGAVAAAYLLPLVAANPHRFCAVQAIEVEGQEAVLLGILPAPAAGPPAVEPEPPPAGVQRPASLSFEVCPAGYAR